MSERAGIPHSRPTHDPADEEAVALVLHTGMTASGDGAARLAETLKGAFEGRYGATAPSGTLALAMALRALDVGRGDEVLCPSYVCMEVRDAVLYLGAAAVLCDIDPRTCSLSPQIARAARTSRTKAIVLPHMFGIPADVQGICELGLPVVEDLAQGLGARIGDRPVGSFGAATVLSFKAIKVLSSGEGGGLVIRDEQAALRLSSLHGRARPEEASWLFPMSDLCASLALSQWSRLDSFIARRRAIARGYLERLAGLERLGIELPRDFAGRAWYRFPVLLGPRFSLDAVRASMARSGVQVRRPVDPPMHRILGLSPSAFPQTETIYARTLSLPLYPALSAADEGRVVEAFQRAIEEATE